MIAMDRSYLAVLMEAGYVYLGMRRYPEARELFEGLAVLAPDSDVPLVALGNVEFCSNRLARAIRHYEQALKLSPESIFAKAYLGEALFFSGRREEAEELLREVAKADRGGAGDFARALLDAIKKGHIVAPESRGKKK